MVLWPRRRMMMMMDMKWLMEMVAVMENEIEIGEEEMGMLVKCFKGNEWKW